MMRILTIVAASALLATGLMGTAAANSAADVTHFHAEYTHSQGGSWVCDGSRVVNKNHVKDAFECTISNIATLPAGTYATGDWAGWLSDYDGKRAVSYTLTVVDMGDGTGWIEGEAYY